jgi:hypothetical protein
MIHSIGKSHDELTVLELNPRYVAPQIRVPTDIKESIFIKLLRSARTD